MQSRPKELERKTASKEGQVLNRVIRWTPTGSEIEADPRHAELVVEQLGLRGAKAVSTPGIEMRDESDEEDEEELEDDNEAKTQYRMISARCNYLAADRPDIQYAVKAVCRRNSSAIYRPV